MMKRSYGIPGAVMILLAIVLSACNLPGGSEAGSSGPAVEPQVWIDAPLDQSQIPLAPYEIVMHAHAVAGVSTVEILINGEVFQGLAGENQEMVTLRQIWQPATAGLYQISARVLDMDGVSGEERSIEVVVAASPAPTTAATTKVATMTPTATVEVTPVWTATAVLTATPASLLAGAGVEPQEAVFGECGVNQLQFSAQVSNPDTVRQVYLFVRLQDANGTLTAWNSGYAMNAGTQPGRFTYTLATAQIPEIEAFRSAVLLYQFVGTNADGEVIGRSQTFNDVVISHCGVQPPAITLVPVTPPVLITFVAPTATATNTPVVIK